MIDYETIKVTRDDKNLNVCILTLNRPDSMNALNTQMALDLIKALGELKQSDDVRVLIITGEGNRSFCVGADLKERDNMTNQQWKEQHDIFEEAYKEIRDFPYPVISAINGFALGGGLEMALSCDLRYASDTASLGLPEVSIGMIPGVGGTQLLPRLIQVGVAKELLFSGQRFSAKDLEKVGLLNEVFMSEELIEFTVVKAREIAGNAPLSLKAIKKAVNNGIQTDLDSGLEIELEEYYKCADSEDRLEGVKSFNEKRKPTWQNK